MISEINYGGRVTDKNDQKLIDAIIQDHINYHISGSP